MKIIVNFVNRIKWHITVQPIAGMVSALKRHHAYRNVYYQGGIIGTMPPILRYRAYKIDRNSRHDYHFSAPTCLLLDACDVTTLAIPGPDGRKQRLICS